jgi:ABC-2 type transport system permease protein
MWERISQIIRKEFLQVLRNRRMRTALFVPPLFQLVIFGYAVNLDVDNVSTAILDQDHTPMSRELISDFSGSGRFNITKVIYTDADIQRLLDGGRVLAVVRVLPNFQRDIARGNAGAVQVIIDGTNSNTASLISNYANEIVGNFDQKLVQDAQQRKLLTVNPGSVSMKTSRIDARDRVWFNADLRSRNYYVPGVMANLIMVVTVMLTAMAIVREKEIGTMEQLMVTPIRPIELMLGKTLPFAAVGLVDVTLVTGLALVWFRVPFRGNFLVLLACAALFLLTSLGTGLFISTISRTQQQAVMSSFFFATPTFMLSGFAFPIRNMPLPVQYLTYLNPLRYFVEIVRGTFLKGVGVSVLWPQMVVLAVYGVAVLLFTASRFEKKLD